MEERDNRFELIRIAIGLADHEVIDLQVQRLRNFSTDPRLHDILQELERKNFRQALFMMKEYASADKDDFFTPAPKEEAPAVATKEPEEEMGLFDLNAPEEEERILGLDDMLKMTRESAASPREYAPEDSVPPLGTKEEKAPEKETPEEEDPLFALDRVDDVKERVEPEADVHPKEHPDHEGFVEEPEPALPLSEVTPLEAVDNVSLPEPETEHKETSLGSPVNEKIQEELFAFGEEEEGIDDQSEVVFSEFHHDEPEAVPTQMEPEETFSDSEDIAVPEETSSGVAPVDVFSRSTENREGEIHYAPFAYMGQKYRNMLHQYPQVEVSEAGISPEVRRFIDMVSTEEYTESQVEAAIARYQELRDQGKRAEAAQMLIAAATTESTFAQFMLARELFKGEVLKQDHPEAFTQINHLAEQDYPEAICDLGQLYEYGIGIDKNKRHALLLYEEAAEMGVERARQHYERLRSTNPVKTLTSLFRRQK